MTTYTAQIKNIVKARLRAIPPNIEFSIGGFGDFTSEELVEEIDKNSEIGDAAIEMQITFIRRMSRLAQ
jgi:hypothetical protein